jgi:hypothetical protein
MSALTLSSEFVDELGFPVEHDVLLVLNCFFLSCQVSLIINAFASLGRPARNIPRGRV